MYAAYALFFFVAFGSKVVLAAITIYLLFPADARCSRCDADTLLIRMGRLGRATSGLLLGTVQRRWCPGCGWEGFGRGPRRRVARRGSLFFSRNHGSRARSSF